MNEQLTTVILSYDVWEEETGKYRVIRYPVKTDTQGISRLLVLMDEVDGGDEGGDE